MLDCLNLHRHVVVLEFRCAQLLNLVKGQVQPRYDLLQRNVEPGEFQNVVDPCHDELLQQLYILLLVAIVDRCVLGVAHLSDCVFDCVRAFLARVDHVVLQVSQNQEPPLLTGVALNIISEADTPCFAEDLVELGDDLQHNLVFALWPPIRLLGGLFLAFRIKTVQEIRLVFVDQPYLL